MLEHFLVGAASNDCTFGYVDLKVNEMGIFKGVYAECTELKSHCILSF